jgi:hypothetical protein
MRLSVSNAGSYEDFFHAIEVDDGRTVSQLLERGFDPNTPDPNGQVGLFLALRAESHKAAEALWGSKELKVDAANGHGETPLMMAALRGATVWCERLVGRGAAINREGWTPLHYAASGPEPRAVALLLERGAHVDAPAPNGNTALMMAARYGPEESVTLLLQREADTRLRNQRGMTAADFARGAGREALALRLDRSQR